MVIGTGDSIGGLSVGVPGTLSAIVRTLDEYGTMSLSQVFAPAIRYARYGWEVDEYTSNMIDSYVDTIKLYNKTSEVYLKNGGAKQPGDMVVNPELANTLELIAQRGQAVFYTGEIAVDILNALQTDHVAPGSLITQEDLAGYQAVWRPPVTTKCNGYDIWGSLTPGSGGVFMGLALLLVQMGDSIVETKILSITFLGKE
jgi:gamma-glutamyltranspeptidase/glutathione hydrolase